MKKTLLVTSLSIAAAMSSQAAIVLYAEYHLGEALSVSGTNNVPLDSTGSHSFTTTVGSGSTVSATGVFAPGSTAYLDTDTNSATNQTIGWYGANFSTLGTDNFAFGIYVRTTENSANTQADIVSLNGNSTGSAKLSLVAGGWAASQSNQGFVGSAATIAPNTWVHLAFIRQNGSSSFWVNGVQQGGTFASAPIQATNAGHLSVTGGGASAFDGQMDEFRIVQFDATADSKQSIIDSLQAVPEPSTALLGGIGLLGLLSRRRRRS